jgi:hypothetical protein
LSLYLSRDHGLTGVKNADDIGMVELGGGPGLVKQAGAAGGPAGWASLAEHFDSHIPPEQVVARPVDHPHASLAQLGGDLVTVVQEQSADPRHHSSIAKAAAFSPALAGRKRPTPPGGGEGILARRAYLFGQALHLARSTGGMGAPIASRSFSAARAVWPPDPGFLSHLP